MSMRFAVGFTWGLLLQCLSITSATAALQPEEQAALVDGLKSIQQAADIPDAIKQRLPKYQDVTTQEYAIPHTSLMLHTFIERYVQANKRITVGVVAVTGIPDMSLFGVGLKAPVLFWTKRTGDEGNDVTLRMEAMPPQLKQYVAQKLGMPNAVLAQRGLNVLGRFGAGAVDEFIESITNYKLENFLVGVAKAKAGADQADSNAKTGYAMTLSMAAQTPWTNPFGLSDTELAGGTVRMTTGDKSRLIEAWGTAKLGPDKKAFTFYVKNTYAGKLSTSQSLGFDVDDASLKDFFMVLGVLEKTLGLPQVPMPKLRLDLVHLQNPAWRALSDPGAPLDFNTMMFKGTRETAGLGELKSNVRGTIFGQPVAEIALNASKKNVIGSAKLAAKLGPLKAESADFHLNAGETTAPDVGIAVRSSVFGELDLKVSDKGLELAIPAACPLRPLGLHGTLDSLAVADFPITPEFADCYSKALGDFVNGVADTADLAADGAVEAGRATATTAADIAKGLSTTAATALAAADKARFTAWEAELIRVRQITDAPAAAQKAYNEADALINSLGGEIKNLANDIERLANEIARLLKAIVTLDWDSIMSKRNEKASKEAERDSKLAQKTAAERVRDQAGVARENAEKAAAEVVGPNVSGDIVAKNNAWLGARTTKNVQDRTQAYATALAEDLKDGIKRKNILAAVDTASFIAERKKALATEYTTLAKVQTDLMTEKDGKRPMAHLLASAKRDMLSQAVAKSIENDAAAWLSDVAVPSLPTISFDMPINILYRDSAGKRKCLAVTGTRGGQWNAIGPDNEPCEDKDDGAKTRRAVFKLSAGGLIRLAADPTQCLAMTLSNPMRNDLFSYQVFVRGCDQVDRFFFDPADGTLRFLVQGQRANGLFCVTEIFNSKDRWGSTYSYAWASPCGNNAYKTYATGWVLVNAAGPTPTSATKGVRRVAGKAAPGDAAVTNLAPLRLSR